MCFFWLLNLLNRVWSFRRLVMILGLCISSRLVGAWLYEFFDSFVVESKAEERCMSSRAVECVIKLQASLLTGPLCSLMHHWVRRLVNYKDLVHDWRTARLAPLFPVLSQCAGDSCWYHRFSGDVGVEATPPRWCIVDKLSMVHSLEVALSDGVPVKAWWRVFQKYRVSRVREQCCLFEDFTVSLISVSSHFLSWNLEVPCVNVLIRA